MVGSQASSPASMRKAAILVSVLDRRTADVLLDHMPAEQAARVRNAVLHLDGVSDGEQRAVLAEFLRAEGLIGRGDAGVELDESLARRLAAAPEASPPAEPVAATPSQPAWFGSLQLAPAEALARHLKQEHPQIIAVVLAHLPAPRSAEVVKQLPDRLQADVLRRVAELDTADPQVLHDLECELERRLSGEIRAARARSTGLTAVASILQAAGEAGDEWAKQVTRQDAALRPLLGANSETAAHSPHPAPPQPARVPSRPAANQPADRVVPAPHATAAVVPPDGGTGTPDQHGVPAVPAPAFEDLEQLDDRGLALLFAAADAEVTLIALSGAGEGLVTRIMQQLPARQARLLRRQMEQLGPLRLSDIEHAQQRLAQLAVQLIGRGEIHMPAPRRRAAA